MFKIAAYIVDPNSIVEDYMIGNTRIRICDTAYKDRSAEDIQKSLDRIIEIGWKIVRSTRAKGKDI